MVQWVQKERNMTMMLSPVWIMVLLHLQVGGTLCVCNTKSRDKRMKGMSDTWLFVCLSVAYQSLGSLAIT